MSIAYRIGLVSATTIMVLLPIVYCAMLAVLGYCVYVHATTHTWWLDRQLSSIGYMVLLLGGATLFFAMLKPLLAPRAQQARTVDIDEERAPAIFELLSTVSKKIGAPLPTDVEFNCDVKVVASLAGGLTGMRQDRLKITIGLPLVAGLSQRQLAGVIAYELAHFNHSGAMRLLWIIRGVNSWFQRVAFAKDLWDEGISEAILSSGLFAGCILRTIQCCVVLGRAVLWVFLQASRATSSLLLRQMDYEADGWSIEVAGSEAFASTLGRIEELADAEKSVWPDLMAIYGDEPLPVDLPELIVARSAKLAKAAKENAQKPGKKKHADLVTVASRLAHGRAVKSPGLPFADKPASALLPDFGQICRDATGRRYRLLSPPEFFRKSNPSRH
jgi:Zn-dependent protease with chaperone function